jgi:excisionase family DNA binding protein
MVEDLLTSKQVQSLLKIERITVYRMLKDHRLQGIKIGKQWRFPASQFENLRINEKTSPGEQSSTNVPPLPVHCLQTIQNLFSDLSRIGTLLIDKDGVPVTSFSNSCSFCQIMQHSKRGEKACQTSWKAIANTDKRHGWISCHAGLTYYFQALQENGTTAAFLLASQSRISDQPADQALLRRLANSVDLDENEVIRAYQAIQPLDPIKQNQIEGWTAKVAEALEGILAQRLGLVQKLQQIAEISQMGS